jgi:hypothetical protein
MPNGPGIVPVQATWKLWDAFEIDSTEMIGWWMEDCPVHVVLPPRGNASRDRVMATAFVHRGNSTLIAMASWANATVNVTLEIDWASLGLPSTTALCAPQMLGLQRVAPNGVVLGLCRIATLCYRSSTSCY